MLLLFHVNYCIRNIQNVPVLNFMFLERLRILVLQNWYVSSVRNRFIYLAQMDCYSTCIQLISSWYILSNSRCLYLGFTFSCKFSLNCITTFQQEKLYQSLIWKSFNPISKNRMTAFITNTQLHHSCRCTYN